MRKELWTLVVLVYPLTGFGLDLNLMGGPIALDPGIDTSFSFQLWVQSEEAFEGIQFLFLFDNDEMNDLWSVSSVDATGNTSGMARVYPGYTLAAGQSLRQVSDDGTVEMWLRPDGYTPPGTYFMATVTMVPLVNMGYYVGFHTLRIPDHWYVMDVYGNPIGTGVPLEIYIGGPYPECSTDEDCDDGDLCTTGTCDGMNCSFEPVLCPEGEVCDPETGECIAESTAPVLIKALSVMRHGGATSATDFAVAINLNPTPYTIEPRAENVITQHRLVFVFDQTIDISAASVVLNSGSIGSLSLATTNVADDTLVATMATAPTINTCWDIDVSGVKSTDLNCTMTPTRLYVRLLKGDVTVNGNVNILDQNAVKGQVAKPVTSANFLNDVDASGSIAILDMNAVKSNLSRTAVCP